MRKINYWHSVFMKKYNSLSSYHLQKETWMPAIGYEGLYEVSNYGRVASLMFRNGKTSYYLDSRRLLSQARSTSTKRGKKYLKYLHVVLRDKNHKPTTIAVHRLVLFSFLKKQPRSLPVMHLDGDPLNNRLNNLCLGTKEDNEKHKWNQIKSLTLSYLSKEVSDFCKSNWGKKINNKTIRTYLGV